MSISGISATPPPAAGAGQAKPAAPAAKPQQEASDSRHIHIDKQSPTTTASLKSGVDKTA